MIDFKKQNRNNNLQSQIKNSDFEKYRLQYEFIKQIYKGNLKLKYVIANLEKQIFGSKFAGYRKK